MPPPCCHNVSIFHSQKISFWIQNRMEAGRTAGFLVWLRDGILIQLKEQHVNTHSSMSCCIHTQFVFFWLLLISSKEILPVYYYWSTTYYGAVPSVSTPPFLVLILYSYFRSSPVDRRHISLSGSSRYEHSMSSITDFLCWFYAFYDKIWSFVQL